MKEFLEAKKKKKKKSVLYKPTFRKAEIKAVLETAVDRTP